MAPIGVAILGSGGFVQREHKPAVDACKAIELKAIYSRSKASAEVVLEGNSGVDIYSDDSGPGKDLDALLARDDIKAVIIVLPIPVQPGVVKKALLAGKHVLSEKPVGKDLESARELVSWRKSNPTGTIWGVAENIRFQPTWHHAASIIGGLGRVLGFRVEVMFSPSGKALSTDWRKNPTHRGGFLLDGGVHFVAGLQILLRGDRVGKVAAFTTQLQEHLPPVDTVNAVLVTEAGVLGTFVCSFGMLTTKYDFVVVCEGGIVTVTHGKVIVKKGDVVEEKEFPDHGSGVKQEVEGFSEAILKGVADERQAPELALDDVLLIEAMLKSGEQNGETLNVTEV